MGSKHRAIGQMRTKSNNMNLFDKSLIPFATKTSVIWCPGVCKISSEVVIDHILIHRFDALMEKGLNQLLTH